MNNSCKPRSSNNRERIRQSADQAPDDWRFLTTLLRGETDPGDFSERRMELLFCHHITGLLSQKVLAEPSLAPLARQKQNQMLCSLRFSAMFEKIAERCQKEQIRVLPLKGTSLSFTLYRDDPGRRQISDIDFLVQEKDVECLIPILTKLGYVVKNPQMLTQGYLENKKKIEFLAKNPADPGLDVHTAFIVKKFLGAEVNIPLEELFARARMTNGTRTSLEVLDPIDEWLYLAYHFALHHRFAGLKWLDDLYCATQNLSDEAGNALRKKAEAAGLTTTVNAVLELLERVYGLPKEKTWLRMGRPIDSTIEVWLEDAFDPQKLMCRDLEHGQGTVLDRLSSFFWEFLFLDTPGQRRAALLRLIFIKRELLGTILGPRSQPAFLLVLPLWVACTSFLVLLFALETCRRRVIRASSTGWRGNPT